MKAERIVPLRTKKGQYGWPALPNWINRSVANRILSEHFGQDVETRSMSTANGDRLVAIELGDPNNWDDESNRLWYAAMRQIVLGSRGR